MALEPKSGATSHGSASMSPLWKAGRALCRLYTTLAFDLKVYRTDHVPPTGGALVVSNHQSYLDPILLGVQLRRPMSYMARATLFRNRFFNWLISNLNAFPVRRGEGDVGAAEGNDPATA
jgi:1-acyl-sn-glycerol-3-phosphate acyltransferase